MPTIRRESADIQYGYLKGYVNVTCEALAEPAATFQWSRHNKPIKSNQIVSGEHISILMVCGILLYHFLSFYEFPENAPKM